MLIFVRSLTGKTITLELERDDYIEKIRELIHEKEGIPPRYCRLVFTGKLLEDGYQCRDWGIRHESTLHIVTAGLRGSSEPLAPYAFKYNYFEEKQNEMRKMFTRLPYRVIIDQILTFFEIAISKVRNANQKLLFGYFQTDKLRNILLLFKTVRVDTKIDDLVHVPRNVFSIRVNTNKIDEKGLVERTKLQFEKLRFASVPFQALPVFANSRFRGKLVINEFSERCEVVKKIPSSLFENIIALKLSRTTVVKDDFFKSLSFSNVEEIQMDVDTRNGKGCNFDFVNFKEKFQKLGSLIVKGAQRKIKFSFPIEHKRTVNVFQILNSEYIMVMDTVKEFESDYFGSTEPLETFFGTHSSDFFVNLSRLKLSMSVGSFSSNKKKGLVTLKQLKVLDIEIESEFPNEFFETLSFPSVEILSVKGKLYRQHRNMSMTGEKWNQFPKIRCLHIRSLGWFSDSFFMYQKNISSTLEVIKIEKSELVMKNFRKWKKLENVRELFLNQVSSLNDDFFGEKNQNRFPLLEKIAIMNNTDVYGRKWNHFPELREMKLVHCQNFGDEFFQKETNKKKIMENLRIVHVLGNYRIKGEKWMKLPALEKFEATRCLCDVSKLLQKFFKS